MKRLMSLLVAMAGVSIMSAYGADIVVTPQENPTALRNPIKGFRSTGNPYGTLNKVYIPWNAIENQESDGIDKIQAYCNSQWADYPSKNIKVVPRIYQDYPGRPSGWPADLSGDYNSAQFSQRMVRLIGRLGQVWDNDPRVAFVETGFYYSWGEGVFSGSQAVLIRDAYMNAFKNKKICRGQPCNNYEPSTFGVQWDSFAHPDQMGQIDDWLNCGGPTNPRWKIAPMEGEVAYDWGGFLPVLGANPTTTVSTPAYYNRVLNCIYLSHATPEGWIASYSVGSATDVGATLLQKAFGYRYLIDTLTYPSSVQAGQPFAVSFSVRNVSAAPMYFRWPVQLNLLNKTSHAVVWSGIFSNTDITKWLPGSDWVMPTRSDAEFTTMTGHYYRTAALRYHESGTFTLPSTVAQGEYVLALAVLDPDGGMLPSLRFAINNYWQGGYHPMGIVGVGTTPANTAIDPSTFFTGSNDATLHYTIPAADNTPPSAPAGVSGQATSYTTIQLSWNAATDAESGIREYNVYRNGVKIGTSLIAKIVRM